VNRAIELHGVVGLNEKRCLGVPDHVQFPVVVVAPEQLAYQQVAAYADFLSAGDGIGCRQVARDKQSACAVGFKAVNMARYLCIAANQDETDVRTKIFFPPRGQRVVQVQRVELEVAINQEN